MEDSDEFNSFLTIDVASRLHDRNGSAEFEAHLRSLANTGFAQDNLDAFLAVEVHEERDWAAGEALAEAYLERDYSVTWPWNMERDKRNPNSSLPGADLVGFRHDGKNIQLVLGEVKTSSDIKMPPGAMNGRSGMTHQIDKLANNLSLIYQLISWLFHRCKGTGHEASFRAAVGHFFESGNKAVALVGILVRDTQPDQLDLEARGHALATCIQDPTTCRLFAIYVPCAIADLPARISGDAS